MTKITIPGDLICRGSFALGTACGRCSKCLAQKDEYQLQKSVREKLDGTANLKARIEALERALDEIIMEATSRNHAIDIARRARAEGGE